MWHNMKKRVDELFPTPIGVIDIENLGLCQKFSNEVLKLMTVENQETLDMYSNWCTTDSLHKNPNFLELTNLIDEVAKDFFEDVLKISRDDVLLSAMWCNVNQRDSQHQIHSHPNSYFSGVLYLNAPEGTNNITFEDPRPSKNMVQADYKRETNFSPRSWQYLPETGLLLIFPSWLEHGTTRCRLEKGINRISLSFNYTLLKCSEHTMSFNHRGIE
jgi:uncharacterized protein (TIGR02466 family)